MNYTTKDINGKELVLIEEGTGFKGDNNVKEN